MIHLIHFGGILNDNNLKKLIEGYYILILVLYQL